MFTSAFICAALQLGSVNAQACAPVATAVQAAAPARVVHAAAYSPSVRVEFRTRADFEPALSAYGRWEMHPRFGRVFVPAQDDFMPYRHGRFHGETWRSDLPYAHVVDNYGRWEPSDYGWAWVPDVQRRPVTRTVVVRDQRRFRDEGRYVSAAELRRLHNRLDRSMDRREDAERATLIEYQRNLSAKEDAQLRRHQEEREDRELRALRRSNATRGQIERAMERLAQRDRAEQRDLDRRQQIRFDKRMRELEVKQERVADRNHRKLDRKVR